MTAPFQFEKYSVFGWIIHRKKLQAGTKYTVEAPEDVKRNEADNMSFWTKGRVSVTHVTSGEKKDDRVPGMFALDRPIMAKGIYAMEALEDSEFWCINYTINRRKLPGLKSLVLADGEANKFPKGSYLFICEGTVSIGSENFQGPSAIEITRAKTITAVGNVYGLIFDKKNV